MSVPTPPRKRARLRRKPLGRPRLLLDLQLQEGDRGWHGSAEVYRNDLAKQPDVVHVFAMREALLHVFGWTWDALAALERETPIPSGRDVIDLRDPPHD